MNSTFSKRSIWSVVMIIMAATLLSSPLRADEDEKIEDYERARQLVSDGTILPLETIIKQTDISNRGELLEIELERDDGRWIYELELLQEDGEVIELQYDAQTGQYLGIE